jgi:hypothetical protein
MNYQVARLDDDAKQKVKSLESELDVILIAYDKEEEAKGREASDFSSGVNLV